MTGSPRSFTIDIPERILADLRQRLRRTRWPRSSIPETGIGRDYLIGLAEYWREEFDWRAQERALNRFPHRRVDIDGRQVHFVHQRGRGPHPLPLILTHGWPSTFYELLPLVPPLTDPTRYGGTPDDAFDVVIPSLPGYAFSDPLDGDDSREIPAVWLRLMRDVLGYRRFAAHGGDIGAMVTNRLAYEMPEHLVGIHVALVAEPHIGDGTDALTDAERAMLAERVQGQEDGGGYAHVQRTCPEALSYALADSPVGLAAWMLDKWRDWSDCAGDLSTRFSNDQLLTTVMLFWATGTIGTSFRIYRDWALGAGNRPEAWQHRDEVPAGVERPLPRGEQIQVPTAVNLREARYPRDWAERAYADLRQFTTLPRGGHFAGTEEPVLLADDIRAFFAPLR